MDTKRNRPLNLWKPPRKLNSMRELEISQDSEKMRLAAGQNDIDLMEQLLRARVSPQNSDAQGRSPLHLASFRYFSFLHHFCSSYRIFFNK